MKYNRNMKILSLELKNFRNYKNAFVEFGDGLNVLYGKNASGKTNMLESVYLSSIFHSPRTSKDKEMVLLGEKFAQVKLTIEKRFRKHTISLQIDEQGKKKVAVDNIPVQRAGELLGILGVVFFSPDEMKLVKDAPSERRRFLDVGLSQQQKIYFLTLQRYNKTLKQKNNLLKDSRYAQNINEMLDVWDVGLAECGATIIARRTEFILELSKVASVAHAELSADTEVLKLSYESDIETAGTVAEIKERLYNAIVEAREKDKQLGYSSVGPHRDDIKIEINNRDSRKFASQGQQRTIALALKLGEAELYKKELGESPVLLLDDVLSELDLYRQTRLLEMTKGLQTILTCTEYEAKIEARKFEICDGTVDRK
ncbi:MAG: DNA replication/repair protein RecF [Clostridia bacterium]